MRDGDKWLRVVMAGALSIGLRAGSVYAKDGNSGRVDTHPAAAPGPTPTPTPEPPSSKPTDRMDSGKVGCMIICGPVIEQWVKTIQDKVNGTESVATPQPEKAAFPVAMDERDKEHVQIFDTSPTGTIIHMDDLLITSLLVLPTGDRIVTAGGIDQAGKFEPVAAVLIDSECLTKALFDDNEMGNQATLPDGSQINGAFIPNVRVGITGTIVSENAIGKPFPSVQLTRISHGDEEIPCKPETQTSSLEAWGISAEDLLLSSVYRFGFVIREVAEAGQAGWKAGGN